MLFVPRGIGCVPHRVVPVGGRFIQVQLLLLRYRYAHFARRAAGTLCMRVFVPVWLVAGTASQDPRQKAFDEKAQGAYVCQIRCAAICRGIAACAVGQRSGDGRSVLLQVHLSTGCARGRHSSGHCQCRHSICVGTALYLETCRSHCRGSAERFVLSPLLQMDLPARRILCAHE